MLNIKAQNEKLIVYASQLREITNFFDELFFDPFLSLPDKSINKLSSLIEENGDENLKNWLVKIMQDSVYSSAYFSPHHVTPTDSTKKEK